MIYYQFLIFIITLIFLIKSSGYVVKSASRIAESLNISKFIIGLTLVSIGTTIPELTTSIFAALANNTSLILGNVLGSSIANIGLILGMAAIITTIKIKKNVFKRNAIFLFSLSILFLIATLDRIITKTEAFIFLAVFLFNIYLLFGERKKVSKVLKTYENFKNNKKELGRSFLLFIISLAILIFSAKYLVSSVTNIALFFNIKSFIIGATAIAIGTSLPELSIMLAAVRKNLAEISVGNIIGANIANLMWVPAITSLITTITIDDIILKFLVPVTILFSCLLLVFTRTGLKLKRIEGVILLLLYMAFIIILFFIGM